jgi:hypothetical protein
MLGFMRRFWFVIPVVAFGMAGSSLYRTFLRPVDPLQPEVVALAQHFQRSGLNVRAYAVAHGFSHSEVTAAAAFEITGFPLVISVDQCPSAQAAELYLHAIAHSPPRAQ